MRHVVIEIPLIKLHLLSIYSLVCLNAFPAPASSRFSLFHLSLLQLRREFPIGK